MNPHPSKSSILILVLGLLLLSGSSVRAQETPPAAASTQLTVEVGEEYRISFPATAALAYDQVLTGIGEVRVDYLMLGEGQALKVTGHLPPLRSLENPAWTIACSSDFETRYFDAPGAYPVTVTVTPEAWKQAQGGSYAATMTFEAACVSREEAAE